MPVLAGSPVEGRERGGGVRRDMYLRDGAGMSENRQRSGVKEPELNDWVEENHPSGNYPSEVRAHTEGKRNDADDHMVYSLFQLSVR